MIKILIADDHPLVREGLKKILRDERDMRVVCEASNGQEVMRFVGKEDLSVLVLDITMPGLGGLDVLKYVKKKNPKLPILMLSMHPQERFALRALKMGAAGYLSKESVPLELVKAIRKVVSGGKYVTPSLAEELASGVASGNRPRHESLSDREFEIMCLIASGKTVREIAEELYLSANTVNTYRLRLLEKMNMKSNAELIHYAVRNRFVE